MESSSTKIKLKPIYSCSLTEEKIVEFEEKIKEKLPAEYRSFLLRYNGAYPKPSLFVPKTEDREGSLIDCLYGIAVGDGEMDLDLFSCYSLMLSQKRLKKGYLPIGEDPGGNQFWIKLSGRNQGAIYFWDHEENSNPLTLMAENIDELIGGLQSEELEELKGKHELHLAIEAEDEELFEKIVAARVDAGIKDVGIEEENEHGFRPLHIACVSDDTLYFTTRLIKLGADVNAKKINRFSDERPLNIAIQFNCLKTVPLLLDAGADPTLRDKRNFTVLDQLRESSTPEMKALFRKYQSGGRSTTAKSGKGHPKVEGSAAAAPGGGASGTGAKKKSEEGELSGSSAKRLRAKEAETSAATEFRAASGGGSSSPSSGGAAAAAAATSAGAASSSTLFTRTARSSSRGAAASSDSAAPTRGGAGAPPEERPAAGGAGKPR